MSEHTCARCGDPVWYLAGVAQCSCRTCACGRVQLGKARGITVRPSPEYHAVDLCPRSQQDEALARIRALHGPVPNPRWLDTCEACKVPYPCPTVLAMGG